MSKMFLTLVLLLGSLFVSGARAQDTTKWQNVSLTSLLAAMDSNDVLTREVARAHFAGAVMGAVPFAICRGTNPGPVVEHAKALLSLYVATRNSEPDQVKWHQWSASLAIALVLQHEWECPKR